jgi:exopolysaccharide/PEP-CTERM locus tyrosine autokinase
MSLVERALKKLQDTRKIPQPGARHEPVPEPMAAAAAVLPAAVPEPPERVVAPKPAFTPRRTVAINKDALRAMDLLPPVNLERDTARQYQLVKRALVAAAFPGSEQSIDNGHLIMLASALPGEGKTFTSLNLALSLALEKDTEVLLVDADVCKPHISRILGMESDPGLMDLLVHADMHPESLVLATDVPNLKLLPAGTRAENATEMIASDRMKEIAVLLGDSPARRIVLFDSPPLLLATESKALIGSVGRVVLMVRADVTPENAVLQAVEAIGAGKPTSLILNQAQMAPAGTYYGYGSYGSTGAAAAS